MRNGDPQYALANDRALMRRFYMGDGNALYELMHRYYATIIASVVRGFWPTIDEQKAADIAFDIFWELQRIIYRLPKKPRKSKPRDTLTPYHPYGKQEFRAWLFAKARSRALDYLKKRGFERQFDDATDDDDGSDGFTETDVPVPDMDVTDLVIGDEDAAKVLDCLNRLPKRPREVLILSFWEGLSDEEIAKRLGIAKSSVRVYRLRGLQLMRECLEEKGIDEADS